MAVKQPQDHKSKASGLPQSEFRYTTRSGEKLVIPPFGETVTTGFLRRNRDKSMNEMVFLMLEEILDEDALRIFDEMKLNEFEQFSEMWQNEAGVDGPESSAS